MRTEDVKQLKIQIETKRDFLYKDKFQTFIGDLVTVNKKIEELPEKDKISERENAIKILLAGDQSLPISGLKLPNISLYFAVQTDSSCIYADFSDSTLYGLNFVSSEHNSSYFVVRNSSNLSLHVLRIESVKQKALDQFEDLFHGLVNINDCSIKNYYFREIHNNKRLAIEKIFSFAQNIIINNCDFEKKLFLNLGQQTQLRKIKLLDNNYNDTVEFQGALASGSVFTFLGFTEDDVTFKDFSITGQFQIGLEGRTSSIFSLNFFNFRHDYDSARRPIDISLGKCRQLLIDKSEFGNGLNIYQKLGGIIDINIKNQTNLKFLDIKPLNLEKLVIENSKIKDDLIISSSVSKKLALKNIEFEKLKIDAQKHDATVEITDVNCNCGIEIDGTHFENEFTLNNIAKLEIINLPRTIFKKSANFYNVNFLKSPNFHGAQFFAQLNFVDVTCLLEKFENDRYANINFRRLKQIFHEKGDDYNESIVAAFELETKHRDLRSKSYKNWDDLWRIFLFMFYKTFNNFGRSSIQPVIMLVCIVFSGALIYSLTNGIILDESSKNYFLWKESCILISNVDYNLCVDFKSIHYSLVKTVLPFQIVLDSSATRPGSSLALFLGVLQSIFGSVLLYLIIADAKRQTKTN